VARIVLVADDSPTIQKRAMGILKGEGFEVETVSNGVAAIKRLAVLHPVAVLADVSMPGRDGYEVCEYVKKSPDLAHVPVLLVASDMEPYDSVRGANVGADGIIKKPFEARELIAIVVKFAEQFEAATLSVPAEPIAPLPLPKPVAEAEPLHEAEDSVPTVVQHVEQEFAAHAGGVAFAEPLGNEPSAFSLEPNPNDTGAQFGALPTITANAPEHDFEFPTTPAAGYNLAGEVPLVPDPHATQPSPLDAEELPSFFKGIEPAHPEPVFIEEEPALPPPLTNPFAAHEEFLDSAHGGPAMVWTDASSTSAPAHEPAGQLAMEPQFITEESEVSSESAHEHSHEHPHDHSHEHPHDHPVNATSLDSFSLDDAAAGQVRFASETPEVVYAEPAEEAAALASPPPEPAPEALHAESATLESSPEVVYADPAELETALKAPPADSSSHEAKVEGAKLEVSAPAAAPGTVHEEAAAHEAAPEVVYAEEAASPEPASETAPAEIATEKHPPEEVHAEPAPVEAPPEVAHIETAAEPEPETIHAEAAPVESALVEVHAEAAVAGPALEEVQAEAPPAEPALEATHTEAAPVEPAPEPAHSESHMPDVAAVAAGIASLGAAAELIHAEFAHHDAPPEVIHQESAQVESASEAIPSQETAPEPSAQETTPEPVVEAVSPKPAVDADALYSIVLKVVMKMAPPMLTADAVEQIAKHLAKEIGEELSIESHKPQA
jgi:CheY-like chemotaxis protein